MAKITKEKLNEIRDHKRKADEAYRLARKLDGQDVGPGRPRERDSASNAPNPAFNVEAVESAIKDVPRAVLAAWCEMDAQALGRLLQRVGVTADKSVDVRVVLLGLSRWIKDRMAARSSGDDNGGADLLSQKLKEEIRSLRKRREWVDTRIRQIKNEFVPVSDVREKMKKLSTALLRAGEQLGQRYGTDAQEAFNAALGGVLDSMTARPASRKRAKASGKKRSSK